MYFIGILTDKNSESNIKKFTKNKLDNSKIIFLSKQNIDNFKNVKFDSIVVNEKIEQDEALKKMLEKSKHVLINSDIHSKIDKEHSNVITYGFNSKAVVTISSATDENYMFYIQENIDGHGKTMGMQEINFKKNKTNVSAYDGMITTIIDIIYNKKD